MHISHNNLIQPTSPVSPEALEGRHTQHNMLTGFILALFFWAGTFSLQAQSPQQLLEQLQTQYKELENFSADMKMGIYESDAATQPYSTQQTKIRKKGDQYLYQSESHDMLYREEAVLLVSHENKQIVVRPREKSKNAPQLAVPDPESLLNKVDSMVVQQTSTGEKVLVIYDQKRPIQVSYWYLNKEGWIKEVHYYYNENTFPETPKVIISYNNLDADPQFSKAQFAESNYLQRKGNQWTPKAPYEQYQILASYE